MTNTCWTTVPWAAVFILSISTVSLAQAQDVPRVDTGSALDAEAPANDEGRPTEHAGEPQGDQPGPEAPTQPVAVPATESTPVAPMVRVVPMEPADPTQQAAATGASSTASDPAQRHRDAQLLAWLLALMHPEDEDARRDAARAMGKHLDPRAQGPLRRALDVDTTEVQAAAVTALGGFHGRAVEEALAEVLFDRRRPTRVRVLAAQSLGRQETPTAAELLWRARGDGDNDVAAAADGTLSQRYPSLYATWLEQRPQRTGRTGLVLLSAAMALHGGVWMTGLASVAGGDPGALSFIGGGVVGGIAPYLLTLGRPVPLAHAAWIASTTTWGLASGALSGGAAGLEGDGLMWAALGGQALGLGAGLLTTQYIPYDATQVVLVDLAGIAGVLSAGGVLVLQEDRGHVEPALGTLQLGLAVGLAAGLLVAPELHVEANDHALIGESIVAGTWLGGWLPSLLFGDDVTGDQTLAGVMFGSAAGFLGGTALTQVVDQPTVRYMPPVLGMVYGSAVGGGTSLLLDDELSHRAQVGLLLLGGAAGAATGVLVADDEPIPAGTVTLNLLTTGWGVWQGAGFAAALDAGGNEAIGATLLGIGLGGATGGVLSQFIAPRTTEVGIVAAGGAWGGWLSGWAAHVVRKRDRELGDDDVLLATLIGSDAGLALGVLAISPVLDIPEARLGWINLGGVLGMGLGTSVTAVFSDRVAEGNLVGTALGLVTAGIVTELYDFAPEASEGGGDSADGSAVIDGLVPGITMLPTAEGGLDTLITLSGRFDV